jgi:hypothetical protein
MTGWCPRCDAVRERVTACPVCGTQLAVLDAGPAAAPAAQQAHADPDPAPAPPPPAPSRVRAALALAALVLGGIAFVAGRAGEPGPAGRTPAAPATAAPTTTVTSEPADQRRPLGWSASRGGITVTAVAVERAQEPGANETTGQLLLRVDGLARGQRVLSFTGLRLRDAAGGLFASPDRSNLAGADGAEAFPLSDPAGRYAVALGPTPPPAQLAEIELGGLLVGRADEAQIQLGTPTPWPTRAPMDRVRLGTDAVEVVPGPSRDSRLRLEVTAAFVGAGRATAVVAVKPTTAGQFVTGILPVTAELRAGGRTLCRQTEMVSGTQSLPGDGLVVSCPVAPTGRLSVHLGTGVQAVPVQAILGRPGAGGGGATPTTGG